MYSFGDQWLVINQVVKIGKLHGSKLLVYWWHFVTPKKMAPAAMGMVEGVCTSKNIWLWEDSKMTSGCEFGFGQHQILKSCCMSHLSKKSERWSPAAARMTKDIQSFMGQENWRHRSLFRMSPELTQLWVSTHFSIVFTILHGWELKNIFTSVFFPSDSWLTRKVDFQVRWFNHHCLIRFDGVNNLKTC